MRGDRLEVMMHLDNTLADTLPKLLKAPEQHWQPADYLPDLSTEEGFEHMRVLREEAARLPEEILAVLVGDMITEEALPSYASWIATLDGVNTQGEPNTAWGEWNRNWCAEENRHGDLLNKYLYLTGRVNMKEVELTIHHLIKDGGQIETENDPYRTFVYTSFQEIATRISHLNVGKRALSAGAEHLYDLSRKIAGDEQRHARAYMYFISKIMEVDPNEAVLAIHDMMKKKITMPAMYMRESGSKIGDAFKKFEVLATRHNIYTPHDYISIMSGLIKRWGIEHLTGLNPAAEKAQEYLCTLPERYRKILNRFAARDQKAIDESGPIEFSWVLPQQEKLGTG